MHACITLTQSHSRLNDQRKLPGTRLARYLHVMGPNTGVSILFPANLKIGLWGNRWCLYRPNWHGYMKQNERNYTKMYEKKSSAHRRDASD